MQEYFAIKLAYGRIANMKILIVNSLVIGDQDATGKTLDNLLNNIPECQFLEYCLDYDPSYHTPTVNVIYESKKSNMLFFICKQMYRKIFNTKEKPGNVKRSITSTESSSRNDPLKKKIIVAAVCCLDSIRHRVSKEDMEKIRRFNPDLIYLNGGNITTMSMSYKLSKKLNIPIVFHMMDNWYNTKYCGSILTYFGRKKLVKLTTLLHERSIINIAIGSKMANCYTQKFKKEYRYAMNCVDKVYPTNQPMNCPLKFMFSGGLHGGRNDTLMIIDKILTKINTEKTVAELYIYTSKTEKNKYENDFGESTHVLEYVPKKLMFSNLASADVLVHVESFEKDMIEYYRYSMSTKIPEYLCVERPILCFGPKDIATVSYIHDENVGITVENIKELSDALNVLIKDEKLRNILGGNAIRVAEKNHLTPQVVDSVRQSFAQTIAKWKLKENV